MIEAVTFTVPARLPGCNEYTGACRSHANAGARMKKSAERIVMQCIRVARLQPVDGPVLLSCAWHERDCRRDIDNAAFAVKFILDALVKTGILAGDGRKYVVGLSHEFPPPDPANPRVVVTIERTSA